VTHETITARVVFRKQVSDGNYGTEAAEVALDVPVSEEYVYDLSEETVAATLQAARRLVHAELARSPSASVRRALQPPRPLSPAMVVPTDVDDDPEDLPY